MELHMGLVAMFVAVPLFHSLFLFIKIELLERCAVTVQKKAVGFRV
jgi:hypothetical protein